MLVQLFKCKSAWRGALCTNNELAVNLLGQKRKKNAKCVVLHQVSCAPLMETGRPSRTPTVIRQLQTQSAEGISSEQAETWAGLPSAALLLLLLSIVPWEKGCWNSLLLFIAGVSPVPSHRHTKKGGGGCFLSRTCIATRWRLRTRLQWLSVFLTKRLISLCCASRISADANECLLWSDCSARRRAVRQALAFAP